MLSSWYSYCSTPLSNRATFLDLNFPMLVGASENPDVVVYLLENGDHVRSLARGERHGKERLF
jgi:hypothetical protein